MLESEATALLVSAVRYGRRAAALRVAGSALAVLQEPGRYAAQLGEEGVAALRRALRERDRLLDALARDGVHLVLRGGNGYPALLGQIAHPPHLLYVKGAADIADRFPLAIVGTRRASAYGLTHTRQMARELAAAGMCIVSGLALGIDAAGHEGALDAGGRTAAVLGGALDQFYPAENRPLMRRILESGGSVISEYPPGTRPTKYSFLQRNRIIAGMALGVLVTEGPRRSGALSTAQHALENGREVFALPGSVDSPGSQLPHMLLADGARLAACAQDVLSALVIEAPHGEAPRARGEAPQAVPFDPPEKKRHVPPGLEPAQAAVCRALLGGEADFDALCAATGEGSDELGALLIEMELDGLVLARAGCLYAPGPAMEN